MAFWRVPKLWPGARCFILGGGPSLKNIDVDRLRGEHVIAVNNAYKLGDWIEVMFFGDCPWYDQDEHHREALQKWPGLKVTTCSNLQNDPGVHCLKRLQGRQRICIDPSMISWNLNSGAGAINLAYHLGVKQIVLLGYDMHMRNGLNYHTEHRFKGIDDAVFKRYLSAYPHIAESIAKQGVEVINATPGSDLKEWPIVDPETLLPPARVSV